MTIIDDYNTIVVMEDTETMTISEFKATCLRVIEQIRKTGRKLIITKNGAPAVMVVPAPTFSESKQSYRGSAKGNLKINGDILSPLDVEWDILK